jgi:hypothetical protein
VVQLSFSHVQPPFLGRAAAIFAGAADVFTDDHVNARASIDDTIDTGFEIVRKLDALVRNKYADNPGVLAEWASASHTERAPRRSAQPAEPPTPPSQPTA